jgi:WD40 repeat protein
MTIEIPFFLLPLYLLTLPSTWIVLASFLFLFLFFWLIASIFGVVNDLKQIDGRYAFARKRVAEKLAKDSLPESVTTLAHAVASSNDQTVIKIAISALSRLRSQESIDALYKVWEKTKHKDLTAILKKRRYVATEINLQVLFALKIGALDIIKAQTEDILEVLLSAMDDRDTQIASAASIYIAELTNKKTIDLICRKWIEYPNPRLQAIIQQGNYVPNDASIKALFYFLLGEWKKYEDLDFDQSLLAKAYQSASKETQTRVGEKAKIGGRIEWVKILISNKRGYAVEKITMMDWQSFIDILESQLDRKEIWKFLYNAPVFWSKKLLEKLIKVPLKQFNQNEKDMLDKLFNLAKNVPARELKSKISKKVGQEFGCEIFSGNDYSVDSLESSLENHFLVVRKNDQSIYSLPDEKFVKFNNNPNQLMTEDRTILKESQVVVGYYLDPVRFYKLVTPDGNILSVDYKRGRVSLSTVHDGKYLNLPDEIGEITSLAISIDGRILALALYPYGTGSPFSGMVHLYSLPSGKLLKTVQSNRISALLISPNSRILFYVTVTNDLGLINLPDGNFLGLIDTSNYVTNIQYFTFSGESTYTKQVRCADRDVNTPFIYTAPFIISPDSSILASGLANSSIHLWSLPDGKPLKTLEGHKKAVKSLAISSDSSVLASGGADNTIHLWSLPDGEHLTTIKGHTDSIRSLVISPDNFTIASSSDDNTIRLWSSPTNIPISKFTPRDIAEIESKSKDSSLKEVTRNAFKFTLALIRLRQQFDIDIEDSSNDIASSEFDIEIE